MNLANREETRSGLTASGRLAGQVVQEETEQHTGEGISEDFHL